MDAIRNFDKDYEAKRRKILGRQSRARSTQSFSSDGSPSKKRKRHQDENKDPKTGRDNITKSSQPRNGHVHNPGRKDTANGYHKKPSPHHTPYIVESPLHDSHDEHNRAAFLKMLQNVPGIAEYPVTLVNEVDDDPCPVLEFEYTDWVIYGDGIPQPDPNRLEYCKCQGGSCDFIACKCCVGTNVDEDGNLTGFNYDQDGRLVANPGVIIQECNDMCSCSKQTCINRVVQRGRKVPMEIFKTIDRGWGVRSVTSIPEGTFVALYAGEIVTNDEAEKRGLTYDKLNRTYLFDLDFGGRDDVQYCVDAMHYGNVSRFFNHSCDPNMAIWAVQVDNPDTALHYLALFANRHIDPYEELTFDYGGEGNEDDPQATNLVTPSKSAAIPCKCGSANCKGNMFL